MRDHARLLQPRRLNGFRCIAVAEGLPLAAPAMAQAPSSPAVQPGPEPGGKSLPAAPWT